MRDLPPILRWYLGAIFLGTLALLIGQLPLAVAEPRPAVWALLLFAVLTYLAERTTLRVGGDIAQSLGTVMHIAAILTFAPPFPLLVTLPAVLFSEVAQSSLPPVKRLFNAAHSLLIVGVGSLLFATVAPPARILDPAYMVSGLPALGTLLALYYVLDVGPLLVLFALLERRAPGYVWWRTYRRTLLPEFAASTVGILTALVWHTHPLWLVICVVPVVAVCVAFRAIGEAEDRAAVLRRRSAQLEAVLTCGQQLQLQMPMADLLVPIASAAGVLTGASRVAGYLRDLEEAARLHRVVVTPAGETETPDPIYMPAPAVPQGLTVAGMLEDGAPALLVPLVTPGNGVMGLLRLAGVRDDLGADEIDALGILATQAAIALHNAHLHERAVAKAAEDGLTGLLNHRAFQTRLEEEITRAARAERPLALVMVDLDNFSTINNTYGHQVGDAALVAVASALRASLRPADVVGRYGGDEFAMILPEMEVTEALACAERARAALAAVSVVERGVALTLDASLGVAVYPCHARTRHELVRAADQAVYAAKHAGKGRVGRPEEVGLTLDQDPAALAAQLAHANMATVEALAAAVDAKDPYTRGHAQRVSAYAAAVARALGLLSSDVARVELAALLHDVGKIGIADAILTKPGVLEPSEMAVLRQHPVIGERVLAAVPFLREILPAVRHHHERWDGRGYPDGLAGEAIPPDAAILAVADAFDAMTSTRTYRAALPVGEAVRRLREGAGTQFAPGVVAAFMRAYHEGLIS